MWSSTSELNTVNDIRLSLESSRCPSCFFSQGSVLGMLCVALRALVTLLQQGVMARVTAQMAATNPHPVVGGPEGSNDSSFIIDRRHTGRFLLKLYWNFLCDDVPHFTSFRQNLLRRQWILQPPVCWWSQGSTVRMSCRLQAFYQWDRLPWSVCQKTQYLLTALFT